MNKTPNETTRAWRVSSRVNLDADGPLAFFEPVSMDDDLEEVFRGVWIRGFIGGSYDKNDRLGERE